MMAMAMATSAAATVMTNRVKKTPSSWLGYRYLLKAIKLRLTLFSINSMDINMVIMFLLVKKPYTPKKNRAELSIRT